MTAALRYDFNLLFIEITFPLSLSQNLFQVRSVEVNNIL